MTITLKAALQSDLGAHLHAAVRQLAPVLVAVYVAGWWLGRQVHALNDWLAGKRQVEPSTEADPMLLDVRALRNAGLGYRKIARQLRLPEWQVRKLLRNL